MNTQALIKAQNLLKSYGNLTILDVPYIDIESNKVTSIVGPSGAGKSTLLHILGTLLKPTQGEVYCRDINLTQLDENSLADFRNQSIGFVFQSHHLLPEFTALENVMLPAMIGNKNAKIYTQRATDLLKFMGLGHRLTHKPTEMSGGEQQRVAIARSLINEPQIILADEPTGNLDTKNAMDIHQLFFQLKNEFGHTFLIVTHNNDLAQMSDRIISMKDGKIA